MEIEFKSDEKGEGEVKIDGVSLQGVSSLNITQFAGDFPVVTLNLTNSVKATLNVDSLKILLPDGKTVTLEGVSMRVEEPDAH